MSLLRRVLFLLLCALPLAAAERAAFGVVARSPEAQVHGHLPFVTGAVVESVWPGSPADKAGVRPGHVIVSFNGRPVHGRDGLSAELASCRPGDTILIGLMANGAERSLRVTLTRRPAQVGHASGPGAALGADRVKRPVVVQPQIRAAMRAHRTAICRQLAAMPAGLNPGIVIDELQAIRNLARDANAADKAWMVGKAGEATLQLRDSEGVLQLHGANNSLHLEAYDAYGHRVFSGKLDTPAQRRAVPPAVLSRLQRL